MPPTIKLSFVIDQDQLAEAMRAMRPFVRGVTTIDDLDEVDDTMPVISARKARDLFLGKPTPPKVKRKVRLTARRLRVKPVTTKPGKAKGKGSTRPSKANGAAPVTAAMVETVRKRGPLTSKDLHDDMVRQGFGLQSSYNALFVAKRQNKLKIDDDGKIALGDE